MYNFCLFCCCLFVCLFEFCKQKGAQLNWGSTDICSSSSSEQLYLSVLAPAHPTASPTLFTVHRFSSSGHGVSSARWPSLWWLRCSEARAEPLVPGGCNAPSCNRLRHLSTVRVLCMHAIAHQKCFKGPSLILSSANESCQLQLTRWKMLPNHRPCPLTDSKKPGCVGLFRPSAKRFLHFKLFTNVSKIGLCFTAWVGGVGGALTFGA